MWVGGWMDAMKGGREEEERVWMAGRVKLHTGLHRTIKIAI